ncbi:MAG: elongator complex protein 3 [Anaerolineae bacterium]
MARGGVPEALDLSCADERERVLAILRAAEATSKEAWDLPALLRRYPRSDGTYAKSQLLGAYRALVEEGTLAPSRRIERRLRGRPVRTISGVAPVAVLTAPYPCPGKCIFCPNQEQAPKSYLDGEPGVLRALQNAYDPYDQTYARLTALDAIGHPTDKIELLVLGGTWSAYPRSYQDEFLRRCFDAMNEMPSATLAEAHERNETAAHRNVGLVIETRPDYVTPAEVVRLRRQGVTKVQVGVQSLNEELLALNRRGHTVDDTRRAISLLRRAGFKVVIHWMPNLYGATPESDLVDFARIFEDPAIRPDEMKIYPTALLEGTELYELWQAGAYTPYSEETLIELLIGCKELVQPYCRINRVMRDIPAGYIAAGTTKSNLRQIVQQRMAKRGKACACVRCREVRGRETVDPDEVALEVIRYRTDATEERFLQYVTPAGRLAGFLRLSLPSEPRDEIPLAEIRSAAMIRELHVYGPAQALGQRRGGMQHRGLGTQLLEEAAAQAREAGYAELAVIAAVGTRVYYRERGFTEGDLYPTLVL